MIKSPSEEISKIGILFSDNDFYFTVMSFMRLLLPNEHTAHDLITPKWTKTQIVALFNRLAYGLYLLKQNGWRYESISSTSNYLTIDEDAVFFNEEVTTYIDNNADNFNGEFFCVDFKQSYVWSL